MKVLIFVHCFFPDHFYGTETYTLDIARNLRDLGHESIVVSAVFPGEAKKESLVSYSEYHDIPVYTIDKNYIPHTRIKDTYYQPENMLVLEKLIIDISPDIIHITHLINHTVSLLEVVNKLGIPVVATFTDFYGFCFNNKLEASDGSLCKGPNIKRSNCLACYLKAKSREVRASRLERYLGKYPISKISAWVVRNLINIPIIRKIKSFNFAVDIIDRPDVLSNYYSYYHAAISPTNFLTKAYLNNGLSIPIYDIKFGVDLPRRNKKSRPINAPIRFGFIGQIAPHKGVSVLVEAFSQLDQSKAELLLFGSQDQDFDYFSKLKQMSKGCNIKFCGTFPKEDMPNIFDRLDFLVIPSLWYENSPLVLLNSLASKTPAIVSDVEGMTEFINSGENGFVFKMGDVHELKKTLNMIILNPQYYLEMTKTTEYQRTTLSMVNEVIRVYEDAITLKTLHG
ncbi:glycosyltransferase family 4 protein [Pseudanabaena sp. FACHB-1998]|uniref:glycosyltransferase family 4 protein n=1 Tax=Pseudanabaena sp. FACHB-1998 TaxID=2692858 RepID=UPI001681327B|nr:glycosyltransferase family 4 protein [Pseudanabaena sp. FACHB-1998]MBD2177248.1 glycosyltransferase family 4 protein [Pseudanabaena sp. FACHB-1998]